jgi:hypothetical protein
MRQARHEVSRFIFTDGAVILETLILKESCSKLKVRLNEKVDCDFVKKVTNLRVSCSSDVAAATVLKRFSRQNERHVASETKNQRAYRRRWARNMCYQNNEDLPSGLGMMKCSIQNLKLQC